MTVSRAMPTCFGLLAGILALLAPPAQAQTGYPPGLCTPVTGTQDVGSVVVGQRFIVQLAPVCSFTPNAALTVTVNGVDIPGKRAQATGVALVDITVLSRTQLSIDDPILVPAICGTNSVTAQGPSSVAQGGIATQTANFTLDCPATTAATVPVGGPLARTGTNAWFYGAVAVALMVVGATLVALVRRRRAVVA